MISGLAGELSDSGALRDSPDQLRARMAEDGYVLMRGLLPADSVARVRAEVLTLCRRQGWLRPGSDPQAGLVNPEAACTPADPEYAALYRKVISLQSFNELAHAESLLSLIEMLMQAPDVIPRPAKRSHLIFPQDNVGATPPHQDFPHEQGAENAYTTWIPLGECPRELGGLAVFAGSHRRGVVEHGFVPGVGGLGIRLDKIPDVRWLSCDYRTGDVLVFHSLTVHGALPNRTADRLRLSADFRYQSVRDRFAAHMLLPTGGALTWEEVYAGWSRTDYQYYWKDLGIVGEPYDYTHYQRRDREVFALAREGDSHAAEFLVTISRRNPDPDMRRQAQELLHELVGTGGES